MVCWVMGERTVWLADEQGEWLAEWTAGWLAGGVWRSDGWIVIRGNAVILIKGKKF